MSRAKQKYFRVDTGKYEGVYELEELVSPSVDKKERVLCPCCKKPLKPLADVIQWGFWEDIYRTFFICTPCVKAFSHSYVVVCDVTDIKSGDEKNDATK